MTSQASIFIVVFFLSFCVFLSVYNICRYFNIDDKEIIQRLLFVKSRDYRVESASLRKEFMLTRSQFKFAIFRKILKGIKSTKYIRNMLEEADISMEVDTFIILDLLLGMIPLIFAFIFSPFILLLCPVFLAIPFIIVKRKIEKRNLLFTQQLPDAMDLLCNALRAGHSLFSALDIIVNEMPEPINKVFKILTDEIAMGVDVKEAMRSLQKAMPKSVDLRFFTTVVVMQREIGGNLIKLLEVLAYTIRERFKMLGELKSKTAQAKISGNVVTFVPIAVFAILYCMAPEHMSYLITNFVGRIALALAILLMIIGYYIIGKITDIEV